MPDPTNTTHSAALVPGLSWDPHGQATLTGELLSLARRLDALFVSWASEWGAPEFEFPACLPVLELDRLDYFASFPHLVTLPATLARGEENLARFAGANPGASVRGEPAARLDFDPTGAAFAPLEDVLTPAACYPLYRHWQGTKLNQARRATMRGRCFRREEHYVPLERQWNFSMREIVCVGSADEVTSFLAGARERVDAHCRRIGLSIRFETATDPFFRPAQNPRHLAQRLDPVKEEMVFDGRLAIGSLNFHRSFFGEAFAIAREGVPASSGCVAFGLERWLAAWIQTFGRDPAAWFAPERWSDGA
jgi:hypothetical protein